MPGHWAGCQQSPSPPLQYSWENLSHLFSERQFPGSFRSRNGFVLQPDKAARVWGQCWGAGAGEHPWEPEQPWRGTVQTCAQRHRNPQLLKGLLWGRGAQAAVFGVKFLQFLGKLCLHGPGDWWRLPATEGAGNLCQAASSSERGSLLLALFAFGTQWLYPSWP